jgi:hypothetical protein
MFGSIVESHFLVIQRFASVVGRVATAGRVQRGDGESAKIAHPLHAKVMHLSISLLHTIDNLRAASAKLC